MKRLLALVLVMILAVGSLTACSASDVFGTIKDTTVDVFDTVKKTVGGWFGVEFDEEENNDDEQNPPAAEKTSAELAITSLNTLYGAADPKTTVSFDLLAKVSVQGGQEIVNVVWTSSSAAVTIAPSATDANMVTVTVPAGGNTDLNYTLTATVTDAAGNTLSTTFDRVVPSVNTFMTIEEYYALDVTLKENKSVIVKGIVTGIVSKANGQQYDQLYLQDESGKGGYYVYDITSAPMDEIKVGMTVKVSGIKNVNWSVDRIEKSTVEILDTTIKTVTPVDFTEIYKNAEALTDASLVNCDGLLVTLKGVEITGQTLSSGYYHFKLGELESYVRISSSTCCIFGDDLATFKANHTNNKGNTADVVGVISSYNKAFYLIPVSVDAFSNFQTVTRTDAEKAQYELDALDEFADVKADGTVNLTVAGKIYEDVVITWTSNNAAAVVSEDGKTVTFTIGDEVQTVTLTATATVGEETKTRDFQVKIEAKSKYVVTIVKNPVAGTAYKLYLYHTNLKKDMYFTGKEDGYYYGTTSNPAQAVDVYVEVTDGGFYLTGTVDNVKRYFNIVSAYNAEQNKIFNNVTIDNSPITVYTFDTTLNTFVATTTCTNGEGKEVKNDFIFGTSSSKTFETISACYKSSASSTCIAYLVAITNVDDMTDADKVAAEMGNLNIKTDVTENTEIELPKATLSGVSVEWTVTDNATIKDGKLVLTIGDEAMTVVLTATVKAGEVTETKTFTFNLPKKPEGGTGIKADLETLPSTNGSYKTNVTVGGWEVTNGTLNTDAMGFAVVAINGKTSAVGYITSPVLKGGLTQITFKYANIFNENNGVDITIQVIQNGQVVASQQLDNDDVAKVTPYSYTYVLPTPVEGEYQIKILNNSPSNTDGNKDRVAFWDLTYYPLEDVEIPEITDEDMLKTELDKVTISTTEVTNDFELTLPTPVVYGDKVTFNWISDNECAVVKDGKLVITLPEKTTTVTLTLEAVCGEAKDKKTFTITVTVPTFSINKVTAPEADKAYKLYVYVAQKGINAFFSGSMNGNYFAVTTTPAEAIDVYLEATEGGYYLYMKSEDGTKTYLDMYEYSADKVGVRLNATPTCVYYFSTTYGTLLSKIKTTKYENDYYFGTYDSNMYIRCNSTYYIEGDNASKIGVSQYLAYLAEITCNHAYTADCDATCNECGETRTDVAEHTYDNVCDAECNGCGEIRTVPGHTDEAGDGVCDNCGGSMAEVEKATIEEAMTKIAIAETYKNSVQFTLPTEIGKVTVKWAAEGVTLEGNVVTVKLGAEMAKAKLTATFTCGATTSDPVEYNIVLEKAPTLDMMEIIAPVAGKAYKLYFYQEGQQKGYFLDGTIGNAKYYITGREMLDGTLNAYLVEVTGGYNLKVVFADGTEKYLNLYEVNGGYINSLYETLDENDTPTVYTFNKELGTLTVYIEATTESKIGTYAMASYSSYANVSAKLITESGLTFLKLVDAVCYHKYTADCDATCDVCGATRDDVAIHETFDNACDTTCICGYVREVGDHVDVIEDGKCDECGVDLLPLYEGMITDAMNSISFEAKEEGGVTVDLPTLTENGVKITWTAENATVTVTENGVALTFGASGKASVKAVFTRATVTKEKTYDIELVSMSAPVTSVDKIAEDGIAFYVYAPKNDKYLLGELNGTKIKSTNLEGATAFYLEKVKDAEGNVVAGEYYLYFKDAEGGKLYVDMTRNSTTAFVFNTAPASKWAFIADYSALGNATYPGNSGDLRAISGYYSSSSDVYDFRAYYPSATYDIAYIVIPNHTHSFSTTCGACDICGAAQENAQHSYADDCDESCDGCGEIRVAPHAYASECDTTCTCGATRETNASHKAEYACLNVCAACGETFTAVADHVYSGCEDTDCDNGCGTTREALKHDYPYECSTECQNKDCDETRSAPLCEDGDDEDSLCDYGCGAEVGFTDLPTVPVH